MRENVDRLVVDVAAPGPDEECAAAAGISLRRVEPSDQRQDPPYGTVEAAEDRVLLPPVADERVLALKVPFWSRSGRSEGQMREAAMTRQKPSR